MSRWLIPLCLFAFLIHPVYAQLDSLPLILAEDVFEDEFAALAQPLASTSYDNSLRRFYYFNPQMLTWESYPYPSELSAIQYLSIRQRPDGSFHFYSENNQDDKWLFYPGQGLQQAQLSLCGEIMPLPNEGRWYLIYSEAVDGYAFCHDSRQIMTTRLPFPERFWPCGNPHTAANPESDWAFVLLCDYNHYVSEASENQLPTHLYLYHHQNGSLTHLIEFETKPINFELYNVYGTRAILRFTNSLYQVESFYQIDFSRSLHLNLIAQAVWCNYALCFEGNTLYTMEQTSGDELWLSWEVRQCDLISQHCELLLAKEPEQADYYQYYLVQATEEYIAVIGERGFDNSTLFIYARDTGEELFSMNNVLLAWRSIFSQRLLLRQQNGESYDFYLLDIVNNEVYAEQIIRNLPLLHHAELDPSGRYLAYRDNRETPLRVLDLATKTTMQLSPGDGSPLGFLWTNEGHLRLSYFVSNYLTFDWQLEFP